MKTISSLRLSKKEEIEKNGFILSNCVFPSESKKILDGLINAKEFGITFD